MQRHEARRLHYDLRLERDGVLASWAVPKGIPEHAGERHLAVHVEDHPLEYATFEGRIPAGEYGAGTVEIWDTGTYELLEEKRDGGLTVALEGARLQGTWTLVPAALDGNPKNWLLIRKDGPTAGEPTYRPMLATTADEPPAGDGWVFEPKWDGFRAILTVHGGEGRLTSRNGNDLTVRFAAAARAGAGLSGHRPPSRTARSVRSTIMAGRASGSYSAVKGHRRSCCSTCSSSTECRSSTSR